MTSLFATCMIIMCALMGSAIAATEGSREPRRNLRPLNQRYGTQYALFIPADYSPAADKRWPLILVLHDKTGTGNDYLSHWQAEAEARNYFVFAPDARNTDKWSEDDAEDVMRTLRALCEEFRIDKKRVLVSGLSAGGNYTYYLASRYPTWFKAAAPIAGRMWWFASAANPGSTLWRVRYCIVHGAKDQVVPPRVADENVSFLRRHGVRVRLVTLPDADHVSIAPYTQILDWFESL